MELNTNRMISLNGTNYEAWKDERFVVCKGIVEAGVLH
jgi:hypothetical protein